MYVMPRSVSDHIYHRRKDRVRMVMHIIIFYQAESVDRYSVQTQGHYVILKRIWAIDRTQHENV